MQNLNWNVCVRAAAALCAAGAAGADIGPLTFQQPSIVWVGGDDLPLLLDATAADWDADGDPDIVITTRALELMLIENVAGRFDGAPRYLADAPAFGPISAADLNGDGAPDLIASNRVFLQVEGGLVEGELIPAGSVIRFADFDSDGDIDVYNDRIHLNDGAGTFTQGLSLGTGSDQALADVNGDGNIDVIAATPGEVFVNIGDGLFGETPLSTIGPTLLNLLAADDVDRDGLADIAFVSTDREVVIAFGLGDGAFSDAVEIGVTLPAINDLHTGAFAHLNGDPYADLVILPVGDTSDDVAPLPLMICMSNGHRTFDPVRSVHGGFAQFVEPFERAVFTHADFNSDGRMDLFVADEGALVAGGANVGNVAVVLYGSCSNDLDLPRRTIMHPELANTNSLISSDQVAWIEADGRDVLVQGLRSRLLGLTHAGGFDFEPPGQVMPFRMPSSFNDFIDAIAPLEDDGVIACATSDGVLVLRLDIHPATGVGSWTTLAGPLPGSTRAETMIATDIDGDNDLDLLVAPTAAAGGMQQSIVAYRRDGSGWAAAEDLGLEDFIVRRMIATDIDGDHDEDLVIWSESFDPACPCQSHEIRLFLNDGSGAFTLGDLLSTPSGAMDLQLADLDGAGAPSLIALSDQPAELLVFDIAGGMLGKRASYPITGLVSGSLVVGDVDADGHVDVGVSRQLSWTSIEFVIDIDRRVKWFGNDGAGGFHLPVDTGVSELAAVSLLRDLDVDGDPELLTVMAGYTSVTVFENRSIRSCASDVDGDGVVGFSDLNLILDRWGETPEACRQADIDLDGFVSFGDLERLLDAWGATCSND